MSYLTRTVFVTGLALLLCSAGPTAQKPQKGKKPATHTVTIEGTRFSPATITVKVGDTIVWQNKDILPHTATSKAGGFDSGRIDPGKSWKYTIRKAADIAYICTYHPMMKGTLKVP